MTAPHLQEEHALVYRVGFRPDAFAWTPWQYASHGRFDGRWDDPEGRFRTLYVADQLLGCLLEVLADFRPDLVLLAQLQDIDDEDDEQYPTAPGGTVPTSWLIPRTAGQAVMTGGFADVRRAETVAALRPIFAGEAARMGLTDLDVGSLKLRAPRRLTQLIAGWLYQLHAPSDGVAFGSRHDDKLQMWAIFEQPGEEETGSHALSSDRELELTKDTPELVEALRIFGLSWA